MTVDREALSKDLLPTLTATGHVVDVARRPDGGGWQDSGGFVPYVVLWPQPTTYLGMLSGAHAGDSTVLQLTCVANEPDLAMRVAHDLETLVLSPPDSLAGRHVTDVRIVLSRGPERDPVDERLWFCIVQPSIETFA